MFQFLVRQVIKLGLLMGFVLYLCGCGGDDSRPVTGSNSAPSPSVSPMPTTIPTLVPTTTPSMVPTVLPAANPIVTPTPETLKTVVLDCGSLSGGITNNRLDAAAKAYILCKHNQTRSQVALGEFTALFDELSVATDMKRLQWDSKLEQVAQAWANRCRWQHNDLRGSAYNDANPTDIDGNLITGTESVGENLAYKGATNVTTADLQYAVDGYNAWVAEGRQYSFGRLNVDDFCEAETCGHFTQLIWANTYKVGCAINYCPENTLASVPTTYFVCDYASAGNYVRQYPYEQAADVNAVCSTSDSGQAVCRHGLTESSTYSSGL